MERIIRNKYLRELIDLSGTPDIKVITGVRRCGKSVLLQQFEDYLKETEEYAIKKFKPNCHNVIMIDEIQLCDKFELAINSLHAKNQFDIYLTGSNAFLLSSDLETLFTGKVMEIKVFPFSFAEYVEYFNCENTVDVFDEYVRVVCIVVFL